MRGWFSSLGTHCTQGEEVCSVKVTAAWCVVVRDAPKFPWNGKLLDTRLAWWLLWYFSTDTGQKTCSKCVLLRASVVWISVLTQVSQHVQNVSCVVVLSFCVTAGVYALVTILNVNKSLILLLMYDFNTPFPCSSNTLQFVPTTGFIQSTVELTKGRRIVL